MLGGLIQRALLLAVAGLLFVPFGAADPTVYKGDSVTLDDGTEIVWGKTHTFGADEMTLFPSALQIGSRNFTRSPELSLSISDREVQAGSSVTISCSVAAVRWTTGSTLTVTDPAGSTYHPGCGSSFDETDVEGEYTVTFDATVKPGYSSTVSTSFDVWAYNGDGNGGGGDVDAVTGDHCWSGGYGREYTLDRSGGVEQVVVQTVERLQQQLCLTVQRLAAAPSGVPAVDNAASYFQFIQDGANGTISSTTVTVAVNRSFARRFDRVVVARFNGSAWTDLPTDRVNASGDVWLYRATAPGFSYYAVRGVSTDKDDGEAPAGNVTSGNETDATGQDADANATDELRAANDTGEAPAAQSDGGGFPWLPVVAAFVVLVVLAVAGFYGYRRWQRRRVEQRLDRLARQVEAAIGTGSLPEAVYTALDEAEQAWEAGDYRTAADRLDAVEDRVDTGDRDGR